MLADVHHDGSPLYVSNPTPRLGETVTVRLRSTIERQPEVVCVRSLRDGEPLISMATPTPPTDGIVWWTATLVVHNPVTHYRWLVDGGDVGYGWLTGRGLVDHDVPDADDFVVTTHQPPPTWGRRAVVYQVYPDRFARSSLVDQVAIAARPARGGDLPGWAVPRAWTAHPEGRSSNTSHEYFGGDLDGVREHLDHIAELGSTILYLTPVFPAGSTHRYDATTFDAVDPLLGGDDALADLNRAAHERGMHVIGDITLNHSGVGHSWFARAQAGDQPERSFYRFDEALPHGYHCWLGVRSLPKFDLASHPLRQALITAPHAPIRRWIGADAGFDGWRVDVANMAGRLGDTDVNQETAREVRAAMALEKPDALLVAEHGHDASPDLPGDGWHGTMNYAGFTRPVWCWLRGPEFDGRFMGLPVPVPRFTGRQFVQTVQAFGARMPWQSRIASWNILSSHDSPRIRTVVGSRDRHVAALALAIGLPGVPMVFAGDEIGATGDWGEDSRTPMPWHEREHWDHHFLDISRQLLSLRRDSIALAEGGMRWVHVDDDVVVFAREHSNESMLLAVARTASSPVRVDLDRLGVDELHQVFGFTASIAQREAVLEIPHAGAGVWRMS